MSANRSVVLDMMDRRPVWAMPPGVPDRIREALPGGWELRVIDDATDGSGDGAGRVSPAALEAVGTADVYLGYGIAEALLEAGPALRWVHSGAAGVGSSLTPAMKSRPLIFTNSAGIHGPPMAETVLAMILHFGRGLDFAVRNQARGVWSTDPFYVAGAPLRELSTQTVGVVGFGGVGSEVARRVGVLGARVVALRRTSVPDPDGRVEVVHGAEGFRSLLACSDVVVLCAPETDATRGMMDRDAFAAMKEGALLINVGRGPLLDEAALLEALDGGRIRGAALDVFAGEPLAPDHPLWGRPNVLITPHVSAVTDGFWEREVALILRNLRRFLDGDAPETWENVVDKTAGY